MKANELRVGNYVHCELWEGARKLFKILPEATKILLPIPLTEEWLLRLGFTMENEDSSNCNRDYRVKGMNIYIQHHFDCNDFIVVFLDNPINISVKTVHQLQNLYFALTGEELELKQFTILH